MRSAVLVDAPRTRLPCFADIWTVTATLATRPSPAMVSQSSKARLTSSTPALRRTMSPADRATAALGFGFGGAEVRVYGYGPSFGGGGASPGLGGGAIGGVVAARAVARERT